MLIPRTLFSVSRGPLLKGSMSAARDYKVVMMVLFAMMTDIGAEGKMLNHITEGYLVACAHVYCKQFCFRPVGVILPLYPIMCDSFLLVGHLGNYRLRYVCGRSVTVGYRLCFLLYWGLNGPLTAILLKELMWRRGYIVILTADVVAYYYNC